MKLSDYVAEFIEKQGVKHTFGITGASIIHVFDSIYQNPNITHICTQHEQAAAIAADAYSRMTGNLGVGLATSGPGATNLITGICCAYFDSIPSLFITGQEATPQLKKEMKVRQIGFQETQIPELGKPIAKYSVMVDDPKKIRYELEKAVHIAKSGRPGPVLIDLPDDVQRAEIEPRELEAFHPPTETTSISEEEIKKTINLLENAERPALIIGNGVKLGKAENKIKLLAEKLKIPILPTWAAKDIFPYNHPLVADTFGVSSGRPGNFAVQNSDLILSLGSRLDTHQTGTNLRTFAREAKKIVVDIDSSELEKYSKRGMNVDLLINSDINPFLDKILSKEIKIKDISKWKDRIKKWKEKYPICLPEYYHQKEKVNPYVFLETLNQESKDGDIIIPDAGSNVTWSFQAYKPREGQKLFTSFNTSPMGYSLPAAIGAYFATKKPIICITGDGGIQMNIQELATIKKHNLPIKIFVFNNDGYGIIQQTQDTWLDSRYSASNPESGVAIPDLIKISEAYGIPTINIKNHEELKEGMRKTLDHKGPILCNVEIEQHHKITPKLSAGKPIEDLSPLLDRNEFKENMIVEPLEDPKGHPPLESDHKKEHGLVLDGHKLAWHTDRVNSWLRGERIAPITVDMALTRRCNMRCVYCYGQLQANDEKKMTWDVIKRFLDDAAEVGVKGVSFMSDGESMCSPHVYDAIVHGKKVGLDMAFATNGAILKRERLPDILSCLTWFRFNISAGEAKRYAEIHGCQEQDFHNVKEIIRECVKIKKENNFPVTIGLQMVLLPDFKDQIIPLTKLGKELGVDYLVIKHCSDDEDGSLKVPYNDYFKEDLINKIKEAESYSTEDYLVKAKWSKILSGGKRKYAQCYGPPFLIQFSGSGLVAPCGPLFNRKYKDFHIGNIAEQSFKDIIKGDRYWEVMDLIASEKFNAHTDCGTLCCQHKINEFLWDLKKKDMKEIERPKGEPPQHINFI